MCSCAVLQVCSFAAGEGVAGVVGVQVCRTACAQETQEVPEAVQEVVQEQEVQVCWCAGVYS